MYESCKFRRIRLVYISDSDCTIEVGRHCFAYISVKSLAMKLLPPILLAFNSVTSGLDLISAFIEEVYGTTYAKDLQGTIEFNRVKDACDDSFAGANQVPLSGDCKLSG